MVGVYEVLSREERRPGDKFHSSLLSICEVSPHTTPLATTAILEMLPIHLLQCIDIPTRPQHWHQSQNEVGRIEKRDRKVGGSHLLQALCPHLLRLQTAHGQGNFHSWQKKFTVILVWRTKHHLTEGHRFGCCWPERFKYKCKSGQSSAVATEQGGGMYRGREEHIAPLW